MAEGLELQSSYEGGAIADDLIDESYIESMKVKKKERCPVS